MKTIAIFSNQGGLGRTSLAYHLGFMFAELGHRIVFADLDPLANLSAMCLADDRMEAISMLEPRPTIYGAIERLRRGAGDIAPLEPESISGKIVLIPGDLQLSEFEDDLAQQWSKCLQGDERAFRMTTAMFRVMMDAGTRSSTDIAVVDMAPYFGAINRAALIAADYVLVPVAPDPLSIRALEIVGHQIVAWRDQWSDRRSRAPDLDFELPRGDMTPLGYVVPHQAMRAGRPLAKFERWIHRIPEVFRQSFGLPAEPELDFASDEFCLANLKDYRSLMLMAQEARRPIFLLKPADGALGAYQAAVRGAYLDYRALAVTVLERIST